MADLTILAPKQRKDCFSIMSVLDRLRNNHHKAAQMFAAGYSISAIAKATNRSEQSIEDLADDLAFIGLVQFYRNQNNEARAD